MKYLFTLCLFASSIVCFAQGRDRFEKGGDKEQTEENEPDQAPTKQKLTEDSKASFFDALVFGGNASAFFGTNTGVFLSPKVGYKVTNDLILGTGLIYQYLSAAGRDNNGNIVRGAFTSQTVGPLFFGAYNVNDFLYVGAQFEYLRHDAPIVDRQGYFIDSERIWSPVLFLEAGFTQTIGDNGMLRLGIRYNVLHQGIRSPYVSPWFPVIGVFF